MVKEFAHILSKKEKPFKSLPRSCKLDKKIITCSPLPGDKELH